MTREDIEKAANAYMDDFLYDHIDHTAINHEEDNYEAGRNHALFEFGTGIFKDGAAWRINSVWHDVNEIPEDGRIIVLLGKYGTMIIYGPNMRYYKEAIIMDGGFIKWAYKEDLMPTNVEE